jgi:hypothetical protein
MQQRMTHAEAHHRPPEAVEPGALAAELAAVLDRLRQVRAQLAGCGVPLAPVLAETDRVIAYGAQLVALAEEAAGPPACR